MVLRNIFAPKGEEVMEWWSKLHNGELYNLYTSNQEGYGG
jgi:hypothetical protein